MVDPALLEKLPPIDRARGYRLYASGGRRFVDLWQYGGRALLGHTPPGLLKTLKNTASRGLFAPLPHPGRARLEKALEKLFPGCFFRIYGDRTALCKALPEAAPYPPPGTALEASPALWRPFWDEESPLAFYDAPPVFVPVLPLPWMNAPEIVVFRDRGGRTGTEGGTAYSDFVSPVFLAGLTRAVYDLIAGSKSRPQTDRKKYSLNFPLWKRRGIYLLFEGETDLYESTFTRFLDRGFLLPPDPALPAILAPGLSPGEDAALVSLLSFAP
ncbi:MAG: hypothetical protein LBI85_02675 [Spirochaetaceae bacterium]|jgi:hypothetical protein|nr:hypothetical protein [Spirochaetaceae bacterium]